jgi:hypothetical protein
MLESPQLRVYPSSLWVEDAENLFHCRYPGCEFDPTDDMGAMLNHIHNDHPLKEIECPGCKLRIKLEGEDLCSECQKKAEKAPQSQREEESSESEEEVSEMGRCDKCGKKLKPYERCPCKKKGAEPAAKPVKKEEPKKSVGGMLPPIGKVFYKAEETEVDHPLLTGGKLHITFIGGKVSSVEVREDM